MVINIGKKIIKVKALFSKPYKPGKKQDNGEQLGDGNDGIPKV